MLPNALARASGATSLVHVHYGSDLTVTLSQNINTYYQNIRTRYELKVLKYSDKHLIVFKNQHVARIHEFDIMIMLVPRDCLCFMFVKMYIHKD